MAYSRAGGYVEKQMQQRKPRLSQMGTGQRPALRVLPMPQRSGELPSYQNMPYRFAYDAAGQRIPDANKRVLADMYPGMGNRANATHRMMGDLRQGQLGRFARAASAQSRMQSQINTLKGIADNPTQGHLGMIMQGDDALQRIASVEPTGPRSRVAQQNALSGMRSIYSDPRLQGTEYGQYATRLPEDQKEDIDRREGRLNSSQPMGLPGFMPEGAEIPKGEVLGGRFIPESVLKQGTTPASREEFRQQMLQQAQEGDGTYQPSQGRSFGTLTGPVMESETKVSKGIFGGPRLTGPKVTDQQRESIAARRANSLLSRRKRLLEKQDKIDEFNDKGGDIGFKRRLELERAKAGIDTSGAQDSDEELKFRREMAIAALRSIEDPTERQQFLQSLGVLGANGQGGFPPQTRVTPEPGQNLKEGIRDKEIAEDLKREGVDGIPQNREEAERQGEVLGHSLYRQFTKDPDSLDKLLDKAKQHDEETGGMTSVYDTLQQMAKQYESARRQAEMYNRRAEGAYVPIGMY